MDDCILDFFNRDPIKAYVDLMTGSSDNAERDFQALHLLAENIQHLIFGNSVIEFETYLSFRAKESLSNDRKWHQLYNKKKSLSLCKKILR